MANIKISELNELYNAQKDYGDYVPIVDTSANETKKISVQNLIPSNVEIIAITDTEPIEYETGDKYYNTTNNRIYTATSGGWINPQEPIKGILYVILEDQKTFTYDEYNETLVSVGGGGGGGIAVYPDEPEEDTKLYIEEEDLDGQYLPVEEDVYSTTETKTNKIWIDNKPVYRKVFYASSLPNTSTLQISTGLNINNITIVKLEGIGQDGSNVFPLNCPASSSGAANWLRLFGNKSSSNELLVNIAAGNDRSSYTGYVVLEYTKTS